MQKALDEINRLEEDTMNTINFDKLRGYVYKARKNREEKMKNDEIPSPLPSKKLNLILFRFLFCT